MSNETTTAPEYSIDLETLSEASATGIIISGE